MPSQPNLGRVNGFVLLKFLGKGTFGAVYEARREEDGKVRGKREEMQVMQGPSSLQRVFFPLVPKLRIR